MNVKHTPATPLPEMGVNINGDFGAKEWRPDPLRRGGVTQYLSLAEKMEAARRCNAYPKLVEALRTLQARLDACEIGPVNGGREIADTLALESAAARALLRSLGEEQ
jgi:hypothetical protein